ncbi:DNA-methyltransferase [Paenibacillus kribbensis]|uniref:DNA-methyltransferase n=1 Tax=Paenibacillus kribbensis TaxID=172713 RepID=UPI0008384045|nr:site-specific DNA-methyltransferase [Paenibacillus kribbensis]
MILHGNCLYIMPTLKAGSFHTSVTSPPYWGLRDYGLPESDWPEVTYTPMPGLQPIAVPPWTGCLGLEPTPEMFVAHMVLVFREVWRLLRDDGTLWLNFGDSYASSGVKRDEGLNEHRPKRSQPAALKPKDLIGIPWRVAFALQADGWYLRMDNIWAKPNPMPESVGDRPTKAHEYMFLLAKSEKYYYDKEAIKEPGVQDEWANGFRGGAYTGGKTFDNQDGGKRTVRGNFRVPAGWDTEPGSHGTIHRTGRTSNSFARKVKESPPPGQPQQHRPDREPVEYSGMRNKRSVWTVATQPFPEAHFATFPEKLIEPCILAGAPVGGHVFDPFGGSGTTEKVALENNRECTIIEMGSQYVEIAKRRTAVVQPNLIF